MPANNSSYDADKDLISKLLADTLPDNNIVLSLRFFQFTIVVSFKLHQRSKDVLILVSILVS